MNIAAINPAAVGYVTTLVAAEPAVALIKDKAPKHWALEAVLDGAGFGIGATTLAATVSMSIPLWPTVGIGAAAGAIVFAAARGLKILAVKAHVAAKAKFGWYARLCAKLSEWKNKVLGNSIGETIVKTVRFTARNVVTPALGFAARFLPWRGLFMMFTPVGRTWTALAYAGAAVAAAMPIVLSLRPVLTPISSSVYLGTTGLAHYMVVSGNTPPWEWTKTVWAARGLWIGSAVSMVFTAAVVGYIIAMARRQTVESVDTTDQLIAKLEAHYPSVTAAAAKIDAAAAQRVAQVASTVTAQPVNPPAPSKAARRKVEPVNMSSDPYSAKLVEHGLEGMAGETPTVVDDIKATVAGKPLPRASRTAPRKGGGRKVRPPEPHIGKSESVLVASSMSDT